MKVYKFGGTSVGSANNIKLIKDIICNNMNNDRLVVVLSAVAGVTNKLFQLGNESFNKNQEYKRLFYKICKLHNSLIINLFNDANSSILINELQPIYDELEVLIDEIFKSNIFSIQSQDKLLSFGELLSSVIISNFFKISNLDSIYINSQNIIITDSNFTKANVNISRTFDNIQKQFSLIKNRICIMPGFIAKSNKNEITTLGRGGSDYTASILAAALNAEELQIWTDVSGMYTCDPNIVKKAIPISNMSFHEALEFSHFGAKVIYPPTIQPVLENNIPILIKNTFRPNDSGTRISNEIVKDKNEIKGISNISNISLLTLQGSGMVGVPGYSKRLFETLSENKINIILITQASSENSICVGVLEEDVTLAETCINNCFKNEILLHKIDSIIVERELAIIAVIGNEMKNKQGVSGKMFSVLGKNNVNIRAIAQGSSERNISAVISKFDIKKALNCLHEIYFDHYLKELNLFITGLGNVGSKLISQINDQSDYLKNNMNISVKIIGISNSSHMYFDINGIDMIKWRSNLANGFKSSINEFYSKVIELNLRNSIFLDITANNDICNYYKKYLVKNVAVIACNKIACSSDIQFYKDLKLTSSKFNSPFLFETNVGAGLPILNTLNNLIISGDEIISIEAVLSGSLNFIFNNYNAKTSFIDVIKQAKNAGYTEPDPRVDLSGVDVARKILILVRECGVDMNLNDVNNKPYIKDFNFNEDSSIEEFYKFVSLHEYHFKELYNSSLAKNCKLKYVAEFKNGEASVGLREISNDHPFYNLDGKDNIVMFYTKRYSDQPLIIKGAGAGADVTAGGLFSEIIKVNNI
jgi:aspartokinase/homoserine dehydrogenase 1